jgi:hypothetical protein
VKYFIRSVKQSARGRRVGEKSIIAARDGRLAVEVEL